jgi:hypothetical protein
LAAAAEKFQVEDRYGKVAMSRQKADIEKMGTMEIIDRDQRRNELIFRRIQFGHGQKSSEQS